MLFNHYDSFHDILLVGDGDFSFSCCLAKAFGYAPNIVATSLDTYDVVISKYKNALSNIHVLKMLGAQVLHGVDATKMSYHHDLWMRKFDRIIFNFPHAGFYGKEDNQLLIEMHRDLVDGFFRNARTMLRAYGEIHVNHKTTPPFCDWNLEELAIKNSLLRIDCVDFRIADYPGYNNKRGDGSRCDEPFPLGETRTFKFIYSTSVQRMGETYQSRSVSPNIQHQPICFNPAFPSRLEPYPQPICFNRDPSSDFISGNHGLLPIQNRIVNDCYRTLDWYLDHAVTTFGTPSYDQAYDMRQALRRGERFMAEHL